MNKEDERLCILSQTKLYVFLTRNLFKLVALSFILMMVVALLPRQNLDLLERVFHVIIAFSIACYILHRYLKKVAYEIVIDFEGKTIEFGMCRSEMRKVFPLSALRNVTKKMNMIFLFDNEKISFSAGRDNCLFQYIEKIKNDGPRGSDHISG